MPLVGFGTYKISSPESVRLALDQGYRHFDCATVYDNQELVGEGLKQFIARGRRNELFITSKVWNDDHHPSHVRCVPPCACRAVVSAQWCCSAGAVLLTRIALAACQ